MNEETRNNQIPDGAEVGPAETPTPPPPEPGQPPADMGGKKGKKLKGARKEKPAKSGGKKKKKKKGLSITSVLLGLIFLAGIGVLLYPTVSDWWNSFHTSRAIANYQAAVDNVTLEERAAMIAAARDYNERLARKGLHFTLTPEEKEEYDRLLDITGTGIMGYVTIPVISVNLPIYHSTEEAVLQTAVGHLEGTSFPVGGDSAHAALSGHRGLPSARLFTDLDRLQEGDIFTITVFDETMTYMIDQIRIVLPTEIEDLEITPGEDYCTLITCTPYGINTHRMLVRGTRIENIKELHVPAEAVLLPSYYMMLGIGLPMLFVVLLVLVLRSGPKGPRRTYKELVQEFADDKNPNEDHSS